MRSAVHTSRIVTALGFMLIAGTTLTSAWAEDIGQVAPNSEAADNVAGGENGELFSISVDGEHVAGTVVPPNLQRRNDIGLEGVDIQVKFDGLDVKPKLNVSTFPAQRVYAAGEKVQFLASSNYPSWIAKAEVRIFATDVSASEAPVAVLPVEAGGGAAWVMPEAEGPDAFVYVLRVYDGEGRFDETKPLTLQRGEAAAKHDVDQAAVAPGYGEDNTAFRNIQVFGGAVTVYGRNVPEHQSVEVLGDVIPVDGDGEFVVQRILPPGDHDVDVTLVGDKASGMAFNRAINIPSSEWFYVGLADFTLGKRFGSKNIEAVKPGDFEDTYTKGRLAFYLKGKIKGRFLLTAAADTGEGKIQDLFRGLDDKDPKAYLKRIDPEEYYPVYGDDSTSVEDAPTRGKFYVRLDRGDSHVMWGNFKTEIKGTEFLRNERSLYGAGAVVKSDRTVASGERQTEVHVYAAQPGTLPQRDVLRGTGGSAYFLKHHDITVGSETLSVEVRDRTTGRLLDRRALSYGKDYTINYLQGVVLLSAPLQSTSDDGAIVRDGALGGNEVYLVAGYEYTPAAGEVDGYVYGGRAQQWLGDHVRIGVTGAQEKTGAADQKLAGADIQLRHSERTYLQAEVARSEGPGFGISKSADGGLTISDTASAGVAGRSALAYRVQGRVALEDVTNGGMKGNLEGYYARKEAGFSSLEEQITDDREEWGAKGDIEFSSKLRGSLSYDQVDLKTGSDSQDIAAGLILKATDKITVSGGVKHSRKNAAGVLQDGSRTDVGGKIELAIDEDTSVYVFGQATAKRNGTMPRNDRYGVGAKTALTDKIDATGEVSHGTHGFGGKALLDYKPTASDHYYMGYTLDPDRAYGGGLLSGLQGEDLGAIVAGVKHSYSERLSVYAEDKYDIFGLKHSLSQTYGVNYSPTSAWKLGSAFESGMIWDDTINAATGLKNSDFEHTAISVNAGFTPNEKITGSVKGEVRFEDSDDNTRDLTAYYLAANYSHALNDNWRMLANIDAVFTDASVTTRDGSYVEGSFGYAYRPIENDRFNALAKYTFLYDVPGADQVTVNGTTAGPAQRSHILNVDGSYDVTDILTVGAKYGFRIGETKPRDGSSGWDLSSAHLAVLRADLHVIKNWDVLLEGRALWNPDTDTVDLGAVAAVYRHLGENFEVGVGYNFGRFSDDMRDLTADDHGVFINAVGKF